MFFISEVKEKANAILRAELDAVVHKVGRLWLEGEGRKEGGGVGLEIDGEEGRKLG